MVDYTPAAGDVEVELLGIGKLWLKPSLEACLKLSTALDAAGPRIFSERCQALNLEAIAFVISVGSGLDLEKVRAAVWETGTIGLWGKCIVFIHNVSNGGRPFKVGEDTKTGDLPLGTA